MRLVRRALAGAAASMALGALFTGVALGAEPSAEADVDVTFGPGSDDQSVAVDLGGLLDGVTGDAVIDGTTDANVQLDATLNSAAATASDASGIATVTAADTTAIVEIGGGATANPDVASGADATADGAAAISLRTSRANLAGAGMAAGSVMLIDLDTSRDDAAAANADGSLTIGGSADDAAADAVASLGLGAAGGRAGANADGSLGIDLASIGVPDAGSPMPLADRLGRLAVATLGGVLSAAPSAPSAGGDAGTGDDPAGAGGGSDASAAPAGTTGTSGGVSLPDTAMAVANEVALWGLILVLLAALAGSSRRLPFLRP